jgi:hypothetical protein
LRRIRRFASVKDFETHAKRFDQGFCLANVFRRIRVASTPHALLARECRVLRAKRILECCDICNRRNVGQTNARVRLQIGHTRGRENVVRDPGKRTGQFGNGFRRHKISHCIDARQSQLVPHCARRNQAEKID